MRSKIIIILFSILILATGCQTIKNKSDAIAEKENKEFGQFVGKQVTEFQDGMLPWAYQNPVALVFDEYDAGRPDVMFIIQRVLEAEGRLTLLDQARVINPNKSKI